MKHKKEFDSPSEQERYNELEKKARQWVKEEKEKWKDKKDDVYINYHISLHNKDVPIMLRVVGLENFKKSTVNELLRRMKANQEELEQLRFQHQYTKNNRYNGSFVTEEEYLIKLSELEEQIDEAETVIQLCKTFIKKKSC